MPGTLDFKENIDVDTQSSAVIRVIARSRERFLGETKGESIDDRARSIPRCVYSRVRIDPERTSLGSAAEGEEREAHGRR